jgi:KUP system potassium uptake protein
MAMREQNDRTAPGLLLAALGVVYGDIGTSPLYAFKEAIGEHGVAVTPDNVYGVLSMIFWAVTLIVSLKYVLLVMRADNHGEGGILALLALVLRQMPVAGRWRGAAIAIGLLGAALFYGDSAITPAISVLSAIEGLEVVAPQFAEWVVPATVAVLFALFALQPRGTARIGVAFGPVMLVWFAALGALGALHIAHDPSVLRAVDPLYAIDFALRQPGATLLAMAAVFLAVTGSEALYADMGHFGARPIRIAWIRLVMPCLLLNYFGQGSLVLADPQAARSPFFLLAPDWLQLPLVVLATAATVIASQAVISGAFSTTSQAIKLGLLPRMRIEHTSTTEAGQIYVPLANWLLLAAVLALVLTFRSSSNLAAAYGIAVALTMAVTTLGVAAVAHRRWDWSAPRLAALFVPLALLEAAFIAANSAKITHGGWFPLLLAAALFILFDTWTRGRERLGRQLADSGLALAPFLRSLAIDPPPRVEGTAVFLTPDPGLVPHALLHNLKHNRVLHARVILLSAVAEREPHVPPEFAARVTDLGQGCYQVVVRRGFQDSYDIADIARLLAAHHGLDVIVEQTSFFLSRQTVLRDAHPAGMARWRRRLFAWLLRNAQPAADFFRIPPERVIEIGTRIAI